MNDRERKRHYAHEALVILGLLALLMYITRIWPILLLVILGIFVAALRLLFLSSTKVPEVEPLTDYPAPKPVPEPSEQVVQDVAYRVIQRRITQIIARKYPDARWVWENPKAREDIMEGQKVYILLNRAGGYNRGLVLIRNLQVVDVVFDAAPNPAIPPSEEDTPPSPPSVPTAPATDPVTDDGADEIPENFGLIAFQWVEAHVMELNEQINEAIAKRESSMVIPAAELPAKGSWVEICRELERNDLTGATCREDGIIIEFEQ